jgi:hypothetical protein
MTEAVLSRRLVTYMRAGAAGPSVEGDVAQETLPAAASRIATDSMTLEREIIS